MTEHLHRDLDALSRRLLTLGSRVEQATHRAMRAWLERDAALARAVIEGDAAINELENQLEEDALKILALHQPVAGDLRFIITALKVNNDLERMGDLAANIGERVIALEDGPPAPLPPRLDELVAAVQEMVRESLNALVERDATLARHVTDVDDRVDAIHREVFEAMKALMKREPDRVEAAVSTISVSRHLERIADLATNIAEDVVFMVEGVIVRHNL